MSEPLFDLSAHYDEMLRQGVSLSGEAPDFFMRGRIDELRSRLPTGWMPARILDFGCGTGESSRYLADSFADADVVGVDSSHPALQLATDRHGSRRVRFDVPESLTTSSPFDLCYVNGV